MEKKSQIYLYIFIGLAMVVLVGLLIVKKKKPVRGPINQLTKVYSYTCTEGKKMGMMFANKEKTKITIKLEGREDIQLDRAMAASGARYTNKDEGIVFWSKGETATLSENNVDTYKDCVIK